MQIQNEKEENDIKEWSWTRNRVRVRVIVGIWHWIRLKSWHCLIFVLNHGLWTSRNVASHFAAFEHEKKINRHFDDFGQVEELIGISMTLN